MKSKLQILLSVSFVLILPFTANTQVDSYPLKRSKQRIKQTPDERISSEPESNLEMDRAAGDVIVSDDFSDPANWTFIDLAGEGANWEIVTEEPEEITDYMVGEMESTTEANGFGMFNGIQYLLVGDCPVQDAVLEFNTVINCSAIDHVTLSFEQRYRAFNTDSVFLEVSDNGGVSYDYSYPINPDALPNSFPIQNTEVLNITEAAAGKEFVKIRFRWIEETGDDSYGSGYGWLIDDLKVYESWNYDQKITAAYHRMGVGGYMPNGMEYYKIPQGQLSEIYFSGKIVNQGSQAQENVRLNVQLEGPDEFTGTSDPFELLVDGSDSVGCTETFTPSYFMDTYTTKYWFSSDSTEDITYNDTLHDSFEVTDHYGHYSRNNGMPTGTISNVESNAGAPFLIGNVMETFDDYTEFCRVMVNISNAPENVGQLIYAQAMVLNEETGEFEYASQSFDHEITVEENGGTVTMFLDEPLFLTGSKTILLMVGHYGGDNPVEFRVAQKTQEQTVLGYTAGATTPFHLENPNAIMVWLKIASIEECGGSIAELDKEKLKVGQSYPNPTAGLTTIEYTLVSTTDLEVEITDLSGRTVQLIQLENVEAGDHLLRLDTKGFAPGIYQYTFKTSTETITKQMIVE